MELIRRIMQVMQQHSFTNFRSYLLLPLLTKAEWQGLHEGRLAIRSAAFPGRRFVGTRRAYVPVKLGCSRLLVADLLEIWDLLRGSHL